MQKKGEITEKNDVDHVPNNVSSQDKQTWAWFTIRTSLCPLIFDLWNVGEVWWDNAQSHWKPQCWINVVHPQPHWSETQCVIHNWFPCVKTNCSCIVTMIWNVNWEMWQWRKMLNDEIECCVWQLNLERTWGHMFVFVTGKNGSRPCPKQCFKPGQRDLAWLLQKAIMSLFLDLWNATLECLRTTSFKSLFWVSWFFDTIQQTKQLCMWASSSDSCFSNPTHPQQRSTGSMNQPAVAPGRFFINWLHSIQLLGFFCVHPLHRTCQKWTCTPWGNSHAPASGQMKVSCSVQCVLPDFAHAIFCLGPTEIKEWMDGWLTSLLAWVGGYY